MADNIAYDIVAGSGGRKTRKGWILDRIATVYNIDLSVDANTVILYAVDVLNAGDATHEPINIGSEHPARAGLYLTDFLLMGISTEAVKVRLVYKEFPYADRNIRIGATVNQVVTNRGFLVNEATDKPATSLTDMKVKYTFPADYEGVNKEKYAGKTMETGAEASKFIPNRTIIISQQEVFATVPGEPTGADIINNLAEDFVGTINKPGWLVVPQDPAGVWMCMSIEGISNDSGLSYTVTHSFQHNSDFWEQTVIYIDPNTSRPPKDLAVGEVDGEGVFQIGSKNRYAFQESADFNDLGLA